MLHVSSVYFSLSEQSTAIDIFHIRERDDRILLLFILEAQQERGIDIVRRTNKGTDPPIATQSTVMSPIFE